jgi:hypothetical protein
MQIYEEICHKKIGKHAMEMKNSFLIFNSNFAVLICKNTCFGLILMSNVDFDLRFMLPESEIYRNDTILEMIR